MKAVTKRIPATMNKTIARIPEITFVKYNTSINAAIRILTVLSIEPIFAFIVFCLEINKIINCQLRDSVFLSPALLHH